MQLYKGTSTIKLVCVLNLIWTHTIYGQLSPEDAEKIDTFINDLMECRGMPGVALAAVKSGQSVLSKGYGLANMEESRPVTEHTVFNVASTTKSMTATLLAKIFAQSNGELSWDTALSSLVEDQFHIVNGYVTNHTKYRDAISHQTGLAGYPAPGVFHGFDSVEEAMGKVRYIPAIQEFREEFQYQNWLYMSAMYQLELLFGIAWQDMMISELLEPLGMQNTTFYDREAPDYEGFATPYIWDTLNGNPEELVPFPHELNSGKFLAGPAGTVCSTASDMSKWMEFILSGGLLPDGSRLMELSDLDRIWYPEVAYNEYPLAINYSKPRFPVTDSVSTYGLGYWNGEYRSYKSKVVSGDMRGFHSDVFFLPLVQLGIFFVTNFGGHFLDRRFIHMYVADILLGYEPAFDASEACDILDDFTLATEGMQHLSNQFSNDWLALFKDLAVPDEILVWWVMDKEGFGNGMPKDVAVKFYDYKQELFEEYERDKGPYNVETDIGVYGEFMHGNLTIDESNVCQGCLHLEYGRYARYTLMPANITDVFWGSNSFPVFEELPVIFGDMGEDGFYHKLYIPWDVDLMITFTRDLTMHDAPDFDITSCE